MEITRSGILMECLEEQNRLMHKYSRHGAGLIALAGYENLFDDLSEKCRMLRAMIIENMDREQRAKAEEFAREHREQLQDPEVQQRLAQWQKDLMDGKQPDGEWANVVPMTPEEALLRRRYRKAEDFKPAPVVYPGGEDTDGNLEG